MLKSIEGNFDHPEVNQLLIKHFIELKAASPEGVRMFLTYLVLKLHQLNFGVCGKRKSYLAVVL